MFGRQIEKFVETLTSLVRASMRAKDVDRVHVALDRSHRSLANRRYGVGVFGCCAALCRAVI